MDTTPVHCYGAIKQHPYIILAVNAVNRICRLDKSKQQNRKRSQKRIIQKGVSTGGKQKRI